MLIGGEAGGAGRGLPCGHQRRQGRLPKRLTPAPARAWWPEAGLAAGLRGGLGYRGGRLRARCRLAGRGPFAPRPRPPARSVDQPDDDKAHASLKPGFVEDQR